VHTKAKLLLLLLLFSRNYYYGLCRHMVIRR